MRNIDHSLTHGREAVCATLGTLTQGREAVCATCTSLTHTGRQSGIYTVVHTQEDRVAYTHRGTHPGRLGGSIIHCYTHPGRLGGRVIHRYTPWEAREGFSDIKHSIPLTHGRHPGGY